MQTPLDALGFRCRLVFGRVEAGVRRHQAGRASQLCFMGFDHRNQQVRIVGPLIEYFVCDDDLVLRLLQFDHLAEFGRLAGLALADDFVSGSNRLTSLPSPREPRRMRARVCFITFLTSGTMASSLSRRPSSVSCCTTSAERFTPAAISCEKRLACPATRPVELSN